MTLEEERRKAMLAEKRADALLAVAVLLGVLLGFFGISLVLSLILGQGL